MLTYVLARETLQIAKSRAGRTLFTWGSRIVADLNLLNVPWFKPGIRQTSAVGNLVSYSLINAMICASAKRRFRICLII